MIDYELKYSLENHKVISIIYTKGLEIIQRNIQVLKLEDEKIIALDIDKKGIRTFKKDRILSAMSTQILSDNKIKEEKFDKI